MWGKLIVGAIGYLLGGVPWGVLIGIYVGHQIDRSMVRAGIYPGGNGVSHAEIQQAFFEATFSVMGCMAKADGRVSEEEISLARQIMNRMGLPEDSRREAIKLFSQGKQPDFPLEEMLSRFRAASHRATNLRQMFIEIQLQAAFADGELNQAEHKLLMHICSVLGFSHLDLERLESMIRAEGHASQGSKGGRFDHVSDDDAYALLNITSSVSDAEVKRAYRRLMNQHHPDKLVAKGLPKEMMKLAEEKTHEIRVAYERIRETRRF